MSSSPVNQAVASPNPILDRQSPLPASVLQSSRPKAIGALVGFGIAVIINVCVFWEPPFAALVKAWILTTFAPVYEGEISPAYLLWCFLAIILSWFAAIAVHECGHAVVGACVGFRINSVRISRLEFHRPFRIAIYKGRGTGAGGWATMLLLKQDRIILRTVAMIFAGPGANLLSLALVLMLPLSRGFFTTSFTLWSLFFGLLNLVPLRNRAMFSDGKRILMLLQNRAQGERWIALLKLSAELAQGVDPEALPQEFLAKATAMHDESVDTVTAHAIAYIRAFYERDDCEAARVLEVCLQYSGWAAPIMREALMSDAAVFQARRRKRIDLAEQWLADIPQKTELPWMRARVEAAILEGKGETEAAFKKLVEIEGLIAAMPDEARRKISLRFHRRWIAELQVEHVHS